MAPPPPGPTTLKSPGRSDPARATATAAKAKRRSQNTIRFFPFSFFAIVSLSFWQKPFPLSMLLASTAGRRFLHAQLQQPRRVLVVDLLQNGVGQGEAVDPPAPLRGHRRRRVVEVLVLSFKKTEVDLVELAAENLLGGIVSVRDG